jgi:hypothetical protein
MDHADDTRMARRFRGEPRRYQMFTTASRSTRLATSARVTTVTSVVTDNSAKGKSCGWCVCRSDEVCICFGGTGQPRLHHTLSAAPGS